MPVHEIYPFWEQSKSKTKTMIEDVLPHYVDGDNLKIALNFIAYLRENKIKPTWAVQNGWTGMCKGKVLYWIRLPQVKSHLDAGKPTHCHFQTIKPSDKSHWTESWVITPYLSNIETYKNIVIDEGMNMFVLDNMHYHEARMLNGTCDIQRASGESKQCNPGVTRTILGKEVKGICHGDLYGTITTWFTNPNEIEIEYIKRLLELEQQARIKNIAAK